MLIKRSRRRSIFWFNEMNQYNHFFLKREKYFERSFYSQCVMSLNSLLSTDISNLEVRYIDKMLLINMFFFRNESHQLFILCEDLVRRLIDYPNKVFYDMFNFRWIFIKTDWINFILFFACLSIKHDQSGSLLDTKVVF